jgi:hypothetical protein
MADADLTLDEAAATVPSSSIPEIPVKTTYSYLHGHDSSIPVVKLRKAPDGRMWMTLWVKQCDPKGCFNPEMSRYKGRSTYWAIYNPDGELRSQGYVKGYDQARDSTRKACRRRWWSDIQTFQARVGGRTLTSDDLKEVHLILRGRIYQRESGGMTSGLVGAVVFLRELYGFDLRESKRIVDQIREL